MRITKHHQHLCEVGWILGSCPSHSKEVKLWESACDYLCHCGRRCLHSVETPHTLPAIPGRWSKPSRFLHCRTQKALTDQLLAFLQVRSRQTMDCRAFCLSRCGGTVCSTQLVVARAICCSTCTPRASAHMCH